MVTVGSVVDRTPGDFLHQVRAAHCYAIFLCIHDNLHRWATQYCLLRWSRMRTGCLCTQEDLCASLWTPSAKLTTCLTKSSLHQVCLAREHVFVARFFKRFLLFGAGNTYGVDTGYGNFTGVVGGFELFRIFLFYNTGCFKYSCPTIWVVSNILVLQYELFRIFLSYNMSCFEYSRPTAMWVVEDEHFEGGNGTEGRGGHRRRHVLPHEGESGEL